MNSNNVSVQNLVSIRNNMLLKEQELYMTAVQQINMQMKELITQDMGTGFVKEIAKDLSGEVARRFFDTSSYYITADQMYDRFVNFSYNNDVDLLQGDNNIKKGVLNINDQEAIKLQIEGKYVEVVKGSERLRDINNDIEKSQTKLFTEDRSQDKLDKDGKKRYHEQMQQEHGYEYDELTGTRGETYQKGNRTVNNMHADHVQPRNGATYSERYIRKDKVEQVKEFYNSPDNFQMIHASANTSKGDIIICLDSEGRRIDINARDIDEYERKNNTKLTDITRSCSAEEIADATVKRWEKGGLELKKKLKEQGYLDENGNVKKDVRNNLVKKIDKSQRAESVVLLKNADYGNVSMDAAKASLKNISKMVTGQLIYYAAPPTIYECKTLAQKKNMNFDKYLSELPKALKRICKYVYSHLKDMFKNIANSLCNDFLKSFFDILISLVKGTFKRLIKIIKELTMSIINCIKTLFDSSKSMAEKGDAITKILGVTITGIVIDELFESIASWVPDFLLEPLQILATVVATSGVMFLLQKLDLFNVRYGLLVANIEKMFNEENEKYLQASYDNIYSGCTMMNEQLEALQAEITGIGESLQCLDIYHEDVTPYLQRINEIFDMQIDFEKEWAEFSS